MSNERVLIVEMEKRLQESEARYRAIVENANAGYFFIDTNGLFQEVNQAWLRMHGYDNPDDVIGQHYSISLPDTDLSEAQQIVEAMLAGERIMVEEFGRKCKDGSVGYTSFSANPVVEGGKVVGFEGFLFDITGRKRAEEALRESEARFRRTFDQSPIGAAIVSLDYRFIRVNEALCRIMGYSEEELTSLGFADITHPDHLATDIERVQQLEAGEIEQYVTDKRYIRKDGSVVWGHLSVCLVKDTAGRSLYFLPMIEDITERKRVEQALWESERKLKEAQSIGRIGNWEFDLENQRISWSDQTYRLYGRDPALGPPSVEEEAAYYSPEQTQKLAEFAHRASEEGRDFEYDLEAELPGGKHAYFTARMQPVKDIHGRVIKLFGIVQDITDRKRAEEALRESEERYRAVVEGQTELICRFRPDGTLTFVNEAYCRYFGKTRQDLVGHPFMAHTFNEDLEEVNKQLASYNPEKPLTTYEQRVLLTGGEIRWQEWTDHAFYNEQGNIVEYQSVGRDITERKHYEEELARSNKELQQFAYIASHDLQEPLRKIKSFINLLEHNYRGRLDEQTDKYIHHITDGATRMQKMIDDLLEYSRVGTRKMPTAPTALEAVLAQVVADMEISIRENEAIITHDPLPIVLSNEARITQVFQNLISNAIKFRQKGMAPTVHISAERKGKEWLLAVRDNGIGVETKNLDKLFMLFERLQTRQEFPGSGLGLAICKKIVERHGGHIWVASQPGIGSTFYFTLPAA